jgi:hypothetical protein
VGRVKPTDYPLRKCREAVFSPQGLAYICELPELHRGPCLSQSIRTSIERRNAWEAANPATANTSLPSPDIIIDTRAPSATREARSD